MISRFVKEDKSKLLSELRRKDFINEISLMNNGIIDDDLTKVDYCNILVKIA
ncbi:MAG: hypothetical protein ACFFAH_14970 [Promethearchaeota archaeon]